jgi:hypothetical protein
MPGNSRLNTRRSEVRAGLRTGLPGGGRHDERGLDPTPEDVGHGPRHRDCGFAGADDRHAADPAQIIGAVRYLERATFEREGAANGFVGIGRVQRRLENAAHIGPDG